VSNLESRLRNTLQAARCNTQLRERLRELAEDPAWLASITDQLGGGHALVQDLLCVTRRAA
jgi:hypothetical protein